MIKHLIGIMAFFSGFALATSYDCPRLPEELITISYRAIAPEGDMYQVTILVDSSYKNQKLESVTIQDVDSSIVIPLETEHQMRQRKGSILASDGALSGYTVFANYESSNKNCHSVAYKHLKHNNSNQHGPAAGTR